MSSNIQLDPYLAQAQNDNVTTLRKIDGMYPTQRRPRRSHIPVDLHKLVEGAQTGMLTTRASDGCLHARAMTPVGRELQCIPSQLPFRDCQCSAFSDNQTNLVFIANNASPKFQELQNDSHVNVSFFDTSTTNWASFSGIARVIDDRSVIKKHWSSWYVLGVIQLRSTGLLYSASHHTLVIWETASTKATRMTPV